MALLSYYPLKVARGELKHIPALANEPSKGITQEDLDKAELDARDKVNEFIVKLAGAKTGGAIVTEFIAAAAYTSVDPAFRHLAELTAAAQILEMWERQNGAPEMGMDDGQRRSTDADKVRKKAVMLAREIAESRKTLKADGSVRRLRYAKNEQGPIVNGPLLRGSYFDPSGTYTDAQGYQHRGAFTDPFHEAT